MSRSDAPAPHNAPAPEEGALDAFNPFRLLDVGTLEGATLDRYAVFLVGLRRTLRSTHAAGAPAEARLSEFLGEVEEALAEALAARRGRRG